MVKGESGVREQRKVKPVGLADKDKFSVSLIKTSLLPMESLEYVVGLIGGLGLDN